LDFCGDGLPFVTVRDKIVVDVHLNGWLIFVISLRVYPKGGFIVFISVGDEYC
jgi:hypothetical protein